MHIKPFSFFSDDQTNNNDEEQAHLRMQAWMDRNGWGSLHTRNPADILQYMQDAAINDDNDLFSNFSIATE